MARYPLLSTFTFRGEAQVSLIFTEDNEGNEEVETADEPNGRELCGR